MSGNEVTMNINYATVNGLVFAVGIVLGMLAYVGDVYPSSTGTILMVGTWFIGGAVARMFFKRDG
jgi:hypothetical protein